MTEAIAGEAFGPRRLYVRGKNGLHSVARVFTLAAISTLASFGTSPGGMGTRSSMLIPLLVMASYCGKGVGGQDRDALNTEDCLSDGHP